MTGEQLDYYVLTEALIEGLASLGIEPLNMRQEAFISGFLAGVQAAINKEGLETTIKLHAASMASARRAKRSS